MSYASMKKKESGGGFFDIPVIGDVAEAGMDAAGWWHENIDKPYAAAMTAPIHEGWGSIWKPAAAIGAGAAAIAAAPFTGGTSLALGAAALGGTGALLGQSGDTIESYEEQKMPWGVKGGLELNPLGFIGGGTVAAVGAKGAMAGIRGAGTVAKVGQGLSAVERGLAYPLTKPLGMAGSAIRRRIGAGIEPATGHLGRHRTVIEMVGQEYKQDSNLIKPGKRANVFKSLVRMVGGRREEAKWSDSFVDKMAGVIDMGYSNAGQMALSASMRHALQFQKLFNYGTDNMIQVVDNAGITQKIGIADLLRNPGSYDLTDEQTGLIKIFHEMIDEADAYRRMSGATPPKGSPGEEHYFPRFSDDVLAVREKDGMVKRVDREYQLKDGEEFLDEGEIHMHPELDSMRKYTTQAEGFEHGVTYKDPLESLRVYIEKSLRLKTDREVLNILAPQNIIPKMSRAAIGLERALVKGELTPKLLSQIEDAVPDAGTVLRQNGIDSADEALEIIQREVDQVKALTQYGKGTKTAQRMLIEHPDIVNRMVAKTAEISEIKRAQEQLGRWLKAKKMPAQQQLQAVNAIDNAIETIQRGGRLTERQVTKLTKLYGVDNKLDTFIDDLTSLNVISKRDVDSLLLKLTKETGGADRNQFMKALQAVRQRRASKRPLIESQKKQIERSVEEFISGATKQAQKRVDTAEAALEKVLILTDKVETLRLVTKGGFTPDTRHLEAELAEAQKVWTAWKGKIGQARSDLMHQQAKDDLVLTLKEQSTRFKDEITEIKNIPSKGYSQGEISEAIRLVAKEDRKSQKLLEKYFSVAKSQEDQAIKARIKGIRDDMAVLKTSAKESAKVEAQWAKKELAELLEQTQAGKAMLREEYKLAARAMKASDTVLEGIVNRPVFKDFRVQPDVAEKLNRVYGDKANEWAVKMQKAAAIPRTLQTGFDFGIGFLHLLPLLATDPRKWATSMKYGAKAFMIDADAGVKYIFDDTLDMATGMSNADYAQEMASFGMSPAGISSEYVESLAKGEPLEKALQKIKMGGVANRFKKMFEVPLGVAQLEEYKALRKLAVDKTTGVLDPDKALSLVRYTGKMTGVLNSAAMGVPGSQRALEGAWAFYAPRYFRAGMALWADAIQGAAKGVTGRATTIEERKSLRALAQLTTAAGLTYYAVCEALGQKAEMDPRESSFMTIKAHGTNIGVGSFHTSMIKGLANVYATMEGKEGKDISDFSAFDIRDPQAWSKNPILKFFRGKTSALSGPAIDIALGSTFLGEPIDGMDDILREEVAGGIPPFWLSQFFADDPMPGPMAGVTGFVGLRSWPIQPHQEQNDLRDKYAKEAGYKNWDKTPPLTQHEIFAANEDLQDATKRSEKRNEIRASGKWVTYNEWKGQGEWVKNEFRSSLQQAERKVRDGLMNASEYREYVGELKSIMGGQYEMRDIDSKEALSVFDDYDDDPETQQEAYYQLYQETLYNADFDDEYGMFDYEKYDKVKESLKREMGADMFSLMEQIAHYDDNYPSMYQELQRVQEKLKPYWEIKEAVYESLSAKPGYGNLTEVQVMWDKYKYDLMLQLQSQGVPLANWSQIVRQRKQMISPSLMMADQLVQSERDKWKMTHPKEAEILRIWYS